MATATDLREAVSVLLHDKATPKDAIAKLGEFEGQPGVETALHDLKQLPWNAKAKAEPVLRDLFEKADEDEVSGAVARIPEIEATIRDLMQTAGTALLSIGELLNEARDEFESAREFLAWALEKFGFKKAYVYRLMNVADNFSQEDVLAGQSIRVLHRLAGFPEEVKQAAREQVEGGENLTDKGAQALNAEMNPPTEESQQGPSQGDDNQEGLHNTVDANAQHSPAQAEDQGAPWEPSTGSESPVAGQPVELTEAPKPAQQAEENPEIARLNRIIEELQAELAANRQERERKSGGSKAPVLPQFSSECMYARLGLSADESANTDKVRKAFRALVKAGYGSQHESHGLLIEARDALMQVSEAA